MLAYENRFLRVFLLNLFSKEVFYDWLILRFITLPLRKCKSDFPLIVHTW